MSRKKNISENQQMIDEEILAHGEGLAERMNLQLFFSTGEENMLWVESIVVTDIVYPEVPKKRFFLIEKIRTGFKKIFSKRKKGFLCQ